MKKYMFRYSGICAAVVLCVMMMCGCSNKTYTVPAGASANGKDVVLYPDYTNVTVPSNIAPLNFIVKSGGDEFVAQVKAGGKEVMVAGGGEDGVVQFDSTEWKSVLKANKGKSLEVTIYANQQGSWVSYKPYKIDVAQEDIDPYLSYRLIEPGFELYRQLGLYQRNLTNFDQNVIYENNRTDKDGENHCINCHNYQNYGGKNMLFHIRASMGGTLVCMDGKVEKVNFKCDSILGNAVYPSWHPTKHYLVFSSNKTGQAFHMNFNEKIEVVDTQSDLLFYNADTHEVSNILKTLGAMETFPVWAPDGKKIYYCVADVPEMARLDADSLRSGYILHNYADIRYNVKSVTFDEKTMTFGEPQLEVDCVSQGKSATVPRVSPDGKYLLFTLGDFGQFHIWHKSSDQYVKNLETGEIYPLTEANSNDVDSYHSWSSNGRWIVFSSRRDDGSYTRPYIAYFDKNGKAHKAFMLPQEDPVQNIMLLKSYNVPELTKEAYNYTTDQLKEAIYTQNPGTAVKYKELRTPEAIAAQRAKDAQDKALKKSDNAESTVPAGAEGAPKPDATSGATRNAQKPDATSGATQQAPKN